MNRMHKVFSKGKAFIPFITAGDPSLAITEQLILEMEQAGADLIEIGIPFSDPIAEGPIIQGANLRALAGGVTTDEIFTMVERIRKISDIPLAFMTYLNPIFVYGVNRFIKRCNECKIDAIIIPDLPFEEREEVLPYCLEYGVTLISMIAPTSKHRINNIVEKAEGFIYCVSSLGVTGVRKDINEDVVEMIQKVKQIKEIPCAIGFGISTPEQAKQMSIISDGVIIGSAIVKLIEEFKEECIPHVINYVRMVREAVL